MLLLPVFLFRKPILLPFSFSYNRWFWFSIHPVMPNKKALRDLRTNIRILMFPITIWHRSRVNFSTSRCTGWPITWNQWSLSSIPPPVSNELRSGKTPGHRQPYARRSPIRHQARPNRFRLRPSFVFEHPHPSLPRRVRPSPRRHRPASPGAGGRDRVRPFPCGVTPSSARRFPPAASGCPLQSCVGGRRGESSLLLYSISFVYAFIFFKLNLIFGYLKLRLILYV